MPDSGAFVQRGLHLKLVFLSVAAVVAAAPARAAQTADYPNRPLRFVVPFPPGASNDIIARTLVPLLTDDLGQAVVVDSRGGANGILGMDLTAKSPPHIIRRFATALHRAVNSADVKQRLASQGIDTAISTPEALRKMLAADIAKWAKVVREARIQPE